MVVVMAMVAVAVAVVAALASESASACSQPTSVTGHVSTIIMYKHTYLRAYTYAHRRAQRGTIRSIVLGTLPRREDPVCLSVCLSVSLSVYCGC